MIGRGSGGPVGAESLGQAGFTSLPAGTGSPAGSSSAVLVADAAAVAVTRFLQSLCELYSTWICTTSSATAATPFGALPLALVPPMSDSDSRTEKRKVNTTRFRGSKPGMVGRLAPKLPLRLHLSLVVARAGGGAGLSGLARGCRRQTLRDGPRSLPNRVLLGKGRRHKSCGHLAEVPLGLGCSHRGPLRRLSRVGRARGLGLEPKSGYVVPDSAPIREASPRPRRLGRSSRAVAAAR